MTIPRTVEVANILVVDDRPDNLLVMEAVLKDSPEYNVITATSGIKAIELVKTTDFALILLDLQMPIMDGYQTAEAIKKLERGKDVPIIMVTAIFKEDPHIIKGYAAGAIDYVGKPFNPDVLKAKVGVYANLYLKSRQIITQNKYLIEAEHAIRSEMKTKEILETLPVGVIIANKSGKIEHMNKEAAKIWGGERLVDIEHYHVYKGWWPATRKEIEPHEWPLARAIEKGERSQYEIIAIQNFEGARKIILNSASPIKNDQGEITGAVDIMQDITQEKWAAEEVSRPMIVR